MIITRTPFRISFFGGGTDYPVFYQEHGGAVLSTTINQCCYITCRYLPPFFDHKFRIRYTNREETNTVEEIRHPSVKACLQYLNIERGVEIVHTSDLPAMSGIGSSSAFTVGLLNALYSLKGQMLTKRELAYHAIHVEQDIIGEQVGSQDQVAAAFGGLNWIRFGGPEGIFVQPVTVTEDKLSRLQQCMLFYFTGFSRTAAEIAEAQITATPHKLAELRGIMSLVDEALKILNGNPDEIDAFGRLLHESWAIKRSLTSKISSDHIDQIYDAARNAGALGGKLCGAGGGGFMLLYVTPERQTAVKEALRNLLLVPFRFDHLGSHVIFYSH